MGRYFEDRDLHDIINDVARTLDLSFGKAKLIFGSLPRPANIIEWVSSDKFLTPQDIDIYKNRGQYFALREFFQCYCPVCSGFESHKVFDMDISDLVKDQLLVYDPVRGVEYCPKCGMTKNEFIQEKMLKNYNALLGIVGMRAGKTTLAAMIMTYIEALLVGYEDARAFFGISSSPFVEIGCIAVSAEQAKETIWAQYRTLRNNSRWFDSMKVIIREEGMDRSGAYTETDDLIKNDVVGLRIHSLNSSSASLAGRTRVMFIIDELGRFDTTESKRSAKEVWRVGDASLTTVRKVVSDRGLPPWMSSLIAIGSPISIDDYSMKMYQNEKTQRLCKMKFSTWGFNRAYKESDFDDKFRDDSIAAARDYGAEPPGAELPFFEDFALVTEMVEDKALVPYTTFQDTVRIANSVTYVGKAVMEVKMDTAEWFIAGDAGRSKDTFSLTGFRKVWTGSKFTLFQGFAFHILPDKKKRKYVDFTVVVPIIERLNEKWKISKVSFDYWNSELIIQELQLKGVPVEQYSMSALRVEDFFNFKEAVMSGKVKLLPKVYNEDGDPSTMDSQTRLYWEMKRMQRSKDLKKVDHSPNSTSDLFEAVVNCWRMASLATFSSGQETPMTGQVIQFGGHTRSLRGW